jgi:hypothetical protein
LTACVKGGAKRRSLRGSPAKVSCYSWQLKSASSTAESQSGLVMAQTPVQSDASAGERGPGRVMRTRATRRVGTRDVEQQVGAVSNHEASCVICMLPGFQGSRPCWVWVVCTVQGCVGALQRADTIEAAQSRPTLFNYPKNFAIRIGLFGALQKTSARQVQSSR